MKRILTVSVIAALMAFGHTTIAQNKSKVSSYGAKIDAANAVEAAAIPKKMEGRKSLNVKVKGKIKEVCQRKGCWMNIDLGNGQEMKVRFKDYAFFVPKDAAGKTVVMEGTATKEETSVAELRHYAEDAGKSKEEIEKITEPEKSTSFEAKGVLIYNE